MAGVAAAFRSLSSHNVVQYILADIPFFCVGILSLGVFTFFIFMKRADSLLFCLHMSVIIAFVSSILDLIQLLVRGAANVNNNADLSSVSGLTSVREVGFALSFGLRFLFFWGFVTQPPPGESRPEGNNTLHNGSWRRWGLLGLVLEMFTLALVLIDPVLQILYRLITSLHKIGPLYEVESTIQVILSVVFILKIFLNCWVKMLVNENAVPIRKALAGYSAVITALVISGLIGIGNIAMFEFSETIAGRFLQAVEFYILIVFMLSYAFYHLRRRSWNDASKPKQQQSGQPSPVQYMGSFRGLPDFKPEIGRPVISSPELLQVIGRDVDANNRRPTLLQRASAASRMSSWMNIRRLSERVTGRSAVPSPDLEKARLWYHDQAGRSNTEVNAPPRDSAIDVDTPRSATQLRQSPWQDPSGVLSRAFSPDAPELTVPPLTHSRSATIDQSVDDATFAIYEESPRSAIGSALSGIDEIIDGYDEGGLRPPSGLIRSARSSRISELIRQQEELDKSIVALRLFSPAGSNDSGDSRPMSFSTSMMLSNRPPFLTERSNSSNDTRATRSTLTSDLSLSNFPDPPGTSVAAEAPPMPPLSRDNSTRSRAEDVVLRPESIFVQSEPPAAKQPLSRPDSPMIVTADDGLQLNSRSPSQALEPDDSTMLVPGIRNHVNSGGTQYEITSFIGRLTQEPGSFGSSSVLAGPDDGTFVPPFARSHGPSSSYGSARSLRPLVMPTRDPYQHLSIEQTVPQSTRNSSASDEQINPEGRTSPGSAQRRTFAAPDGRFSKPAVADAYYMLSDATRRREYDDLYASRGPQDRTSEPGSSANFFNTFASMFGGGTPSAGAQSPPGAAGEQPDADHVFADVFEDVRVMLCLHVQCSMLTNLFDAQLLRPEVQRHAPWWAWLGAICGAGLGFIIANIPGLMVGAYAGNRLGAVRDAKGKSVAAVFSQLGGGQKAEILRALAAKVLGAAAKRTSARESMQDEGIFLPYTSTQPIAGPSRRLTLNMPAIDEQRSAGEYAPADGGVQEIGLLTPAPSQSKFTSKPQSTRRRTSTATSKKDKGKQKATLDDAPSEDDTESVRSAPETSRPAKRRRTSRSGGLDGQLPNDPLSDRTPHPQSSDDMEEDTHFEAELEASFQLLDISDVAALSTIPIDPTISLPISEKEGSLYVPPAVARIIDTLKHALVLERTARQRAEERYGDELRRRVHAELVTDMLTQKNAVLEVETRVWANAAADTFAEQFAALQGFPGARRGRRALCPRRRRS
ncbi:hypothetical protein EVJ58_g9629 [Rhodofomes roseus]|uniref:J domain-containing protein n=1 Tax=Rhodofomes roseus TaxID=34475 RepID=A0A4Y9XX05_9APHY|nr:hypothetical protein EVJ58_g9629 [Rhodofomes roseus]